MREKNEIALLEVLCVFAFALLLAVPAVLPQKPLSNDSLTAATAAPTTKNVEVPVLSYCAHWYARDGNACVSSAKAGEQVGVNAFDSQQLARAANNCSKSGCKISLYCECASAADVSRVQQVFAQAVNTYGAQIFVAEVEVDGIRDIPGSRIAVAQALKRAGFSLILKNMANVAELSVHVPVARVIYEDIGPTGSYAAEMRQLAAQYPKLLITGILHSGCYASDLGGACYPGATPEQAAQSFKQFEQFKNIELFYGMPSSYIKAKSFDGSLGSITTGIGTFTSTSPTPASLTNSPTSFLSSLFPQNFANSQPVASPLQGPQTSPVSSAFYDAYTQTAQPGVQTTGTQANTTARIDAIDGSEAAATPTSLGVSISIAPADPQFIESTSSSVTSGTTVPGPKEAGTTFQNGSTPTASLNPQVLGFLSGMLQKIAQILSAASLLVEGR